MKNLRAISLLFAANIISGFAQGISILAIPWYFADILDQTRTFSLTFGLVTFISIFWILIAGTLIDRFPRKNIFIIGSLIAGIGMFIASATGYYSGFIPIWLILLVFAVTSLFFNIHYPALYAFGQEITEPKHYGRINSMIEVQGQGTRIISGAFAAIILSGTSSEVIDLLGIPLRLPFTIHPWELHEIFLLDGITYFVAIILIWLIRFKPIREKIIDRGSIPERLKFALNFFRTNPQVFLFGVLSHMVFAFALVQIIIVLPEYVESYLQRSADTFASGQVYYGIGALLAGFFVRRVFRRTETVRSVIILMIGFTLICLCLGTQNNLYVFFFSMLVVGITNAGVRIERVTYLFQQIPNNVIGRCNSVFSLINTIVRLIFIGLFSLAAFHGEGKAQLPYIVGAITTAVSTVLMILNYKRIVFSSPTDQEPISAPEEL
jgi:MFS family permease